LPQTGSVWRGGWWEHFTKTRVLLVISESRGY